MRDVALASGGAILGTMSDPAPNESPAHPLGPGASPRAIREALLPEDQDRFDVAYDSALSTARARLDLTELFDTLEQWRRLAALQADAADFRRVVRRADELLNGQRAPADEPLSATRRRIGL